MLIELFSPASIIPESNMENRNQVRSFGLVSSKLGGRGIEKVLGDSTIILLFYFFPIHDPNVKHPWCRLWVGVSIEIAKILACQTKLSPRSGDTHGYQPALITITHSVLPVLAVRAAHLDPELDNADTLVPIWICVMVRGCKTKPPLWVCCHHTGRADPFYPGTMVWWKNADMFNIG